MRPFYPLTLLILILPAWFPPLLAAPSAIKVTLGVGFSETVRVENLQRAAMANGRVAKVKAVPPETLLITGMHAGHTTLRYWDRAGTERSCEITVLPPDLYEQYGERAEPEVVKVSLEFLEMDSAISQSLGVRWPEAIHFSGGAAMMGDAARMGLNLSASFASAQGWINHLIREGWAHILASPDLYVRLGEEALFHSGGEFPVPTSSENYGRYQRHIEWKPFGITVKVRPQSGDRFHINSDIRVDISEVNSAGSVDGIPAVTKRNLETKMNSQDGETVILSGLLRQVSTREKEGLPFLSSIPLLGAWLFSSHRHSDENSEIMMAVTFSLSTRARARERLDSFRERYRAEME